MPAAKPSHPLFARGLFCVAVSLLGGCAATGEILVAPPPGVIIGAPPGAAQPLDIPKGHYPPPGSCRIWMPGVPAGQQSPPGRCAELERRVPPGALLVRG